jgi:hypothetical protein
VYYDDYKEWHTSALEVFWPFTLLFSITLVGYLRESPSGTQNNYQKNQILNFYYNQAELDMLEHRADVIILENGTRQHSKMSHVKHKLKKLFKESKFEEIFVQVENKNRMTLRQNLDQIYKFEFKYSKPREIIVKIVLIFLVIIIGILHGFFPTIYRAYQTNYTYPTNITKPTLVQLIEITFIIDSIIIYFIFMSIILYTYHLYHIILIQLKNIMQKTTNTNEYDIASFCDPYFDLKDPINLDLFLCQIQNVIHIRNTLQYQVNIIFQIFSFDFL